jgi:molybdopterin synthase sulfur carrier subunit
VTSVRVALPAHLRTLARVGPEVRVEVSDTPTIRGVLDALESAYPALRGTIRDQASAERRPFMRYFACGRDLSHHPMDEPLPDPVVRGEEDFCVIGAIAGG